MEHNFPHDTEMERVLLCSLMIEPKNIPTVGEMFDEEQVIYDPVNAVIFDAIVALYRDGTAIDCFTIIDYLREHQKLDLIGGEQTVYGIAQMTHSSLHAVTHAEKLIELKNRRTMLAACISMARECETNHSVAEILEEYDATVKKLSTKDADIASYRTVVPDAMKEIRRVYGEDRTGTPVEIMTGFTRLDQLTGGWCPGRLVLLAGKTQDGKSFLSQQWAHEAARQGVSVLIFSLEMQKETMGLRAIEIERKVSLLHHDIRSLQIEDIDDIAKQANNNIRTMPIYLMDKPAISLYVLESKIAGFREAHDRAMIIIDYLTLLKGASAESRRLEVESISRGLKEYSKKYTVPILAIAQLNRESGRENRAPKLFDLRESGSLEQDADQCIFLYNPNDKEKDNIIEEYNFEKPVAKEELRMLMLLKNRHGPIKDIPIQSQGFYFSELKYR